jgi:hypothetical protein
MSLKSEKCPQPQYSVEQVRQVAMIFVAEGGVKTRTLARIREVLFPKFGDATLDNWVKRNRHGFNDEVKRFQAQAEADDEVRRAVDSKHWIVIALEANQRRMRFFRQLWDGLTRIPDCDKCERKLATEDQLQTVVSLEKILENIEESAIRIREFAEVLANPKGAADARRIGESIMRRLLAVANDEQKKVMRELVAKVKVHVL